jgi:hydrogenase nickel incorporation protein HypA/HybF
VHEIGIASEILEAVAAEARRRPHAAFVAVGVRIGELSNIDRDALDFAFTALTRDTPLQNLQLEIEWCPRRQRCPLCGESFTVENCALTCPACGEERTTCIGGNELDIAYWEVEEPCAKP